MGFSHHRTVLPGPATALALACAVPVAAMAGEPLHITVTESAGVYEVPAPGEVALYSTPVHYEVITREQFAGRLEDLGTVLERSLGAQVQQSGGLGSFSTITLRGAASEQVLIFVDGIPLNEAAGGGVDLSTFDLDELERVEIYRGATPLELGGASIGGAVNLVTRKPGAAPRVRLLAGGGSFNSYQLGAGANGGGERDRWLINGSWRGSDNDFEIVNDNGTAFNPDDDFSERRNNADFEQRNLLLAWRHRAGPDSVLSTALQGFSKEQGLPDQSNSAANRARFDTESLRVHTRLETSHLLSAATSASAGLFAEHKEERFDDRDGRIGLLAQHTLGTTERYGGEAFVNRIGGATTLRGLGALLHERFGFEDLQGVLASSDSRRLAGTLGIEVNHYLLDNRLILSGVARQQWIDDHLEVAGGSVGNRPLDEDARHAFFSPQLGLKYFIDAHSHVKANAGRYARVPAFFELFGDRGFLLGNADLQPETGVNLDLGWQYTWDAPRAWYHDARLNIELFHNRAQDLIVRVFNARGVGRSENVSDAVIDGASIALDLQPTERLQAGVAATLLDTRIESDVVAFDGNRLPNRFAETYRLTLAWRRDAWRLSAEAEVRRGMFFDTPNLLPADDQQQLDLAARYVAARWSATVQLDNALDEALQDFNGFPKPGRRWLLTLTAEF